RGRGRAVGGRRAGPARHASGELASRGGCRAGRSPHAERPDQGDGGSAGDGDPGGYVHVSTFHLAETEADPRRPGTPGTSGSALSSSDVSPGRYPERRGGWAGRLGRGERVAGIARADGGRGLTGTRPSPGGTGWYYAGTLSV